LKVPSTNDFLLNFASNLVKAKAMTYSDFRIKQKSFHSSEGTIKYIDAGEGEVLLLLHGVPTSGWLYRHMIPELAKTHRVIAPDMLGFGSSDSPKGYDIYSEENHAKRLLSLMESLEIENWNHVVHDAGGLWTWEMLRQKPSCVSKLVILNTIIYEEGFKPPVRLTKGLIARIAMWSYRNGITTNLMIRGLFKSGLIENTLEKKDIEGYKTPLLEGKTKAMYYFFTQTCKALPDHAAILQNSHIPTSVIWGKHDQFLLWKPQKDPVIKDLNLSEENIHLIEGKHFIQEEQPKEIAQYILEFLE
jgi:pimeloyl-ACP methyl ester carboxylesterase